MGSSFFQDFDTIRNHYLDLSNKNYSAGIIVLMIVSAVAADPIPMSLTLDLAIILRTQAATETSASPRIT